VDEATRALVALSAALSAGGRGRLSEALDRAATVAGAGTVEETLLQSYLFLGYPAALNAFALWRERSGREAPAPTADDWEGWQRRGAVVCARVYGEQYERLRANVARLQPELERWMLTEGYGKVLGRPGLELRVRELCIVALLAGVDAAPQLHAHLRGALRVGATVAEVEEAVSIAAAGLAPERAAAARSIWDEVRRRWLERRGEARGDEADGHVR
jgi:4-carboxymuconolactone decarboxylase